MLRIDRGLVTKLIVTQLSTALTGTDPIPAYVPPGREQPSADETDAQRWCTLVRIDYQSSTRRQADNDIDRATLTVILNVYVNAAAVKADAYALAKALTAAADALSFQRLADSPLTHTVDLHEAQTAEDAPDSWGGKAGRGAAGGMTGSVTVTGTVMRSG